MQTETRNNFSDSNDLISSGKVRGTTVYDDSGQKLGTIDEIMIGKQGGEVAYALMSFGGFLGIGEKYHPLPWDALEYDTELAGYRVGSVGENFRDAPNYSRDQFGEGSWLDETDEYYAQGSTGSWLSRRGMSREGSQSYSQADDYPGGASSGSSVSSAAGYSRSSDGNEADPSRVDGADVERGVDDDGEDAAFDQRRPPLNN